MRRLVFALAAVLLLSVAALATMDVVQGRAPLGLGIIDHEVQGEALREITAPDAVDAPEVPNIGFIDSPSATCYQPDPEQNLCYINWYYLSVSASPNYMITMTATLNDYGPVANVQGFFQTSMYVPYNMLGQGIRVPCGSLGQGGVPNLGKAYGYTIRARDSAGLSSANYGTVYCPAYLP